MVEISLHILDIAQNSIKAKASIVEIEVNEDIAANLLTVIIKDNGCGMDKDFLKDVTNPFRTSRTTRKVGLGLSMFKSAAELTGGSLDIWSEVGVGTVVKVNFVYDSIDRQPLGDMATTMTTIIGGAPDIDYIYRHSYSGKSFDMDTRQLRKVLGEEISLAEIDVLNWIDDYIKTETENIYGGAV
jgi:hypothetical protein